MNCEADYLCGVLGSFIKKTEPPAQPHGVAWPHLEKLAARNLVMPIVDYVIGDSGLPSELHQRWNQHAIGIELHYARARAATLKLCRILESGEVPSVVMRGMALAPWLYPSPALRPMVDVDILVAPAARRTLFAILKKCGLSPVLNLRSQYVYQIDGVVFEIHWSFLTPRRYRGLIDGVDWRASRRPLPGWDGKVFGLSRENELIALVCHSFVHHEIDKLLPLVDISLVARLEGLDWRYISEWCEKHSVGRMFWFTIAFVDALFSLGLPRQIEPSGVRFPPIRKRTFEAYRAPLFVEDARAHFLRRKLHLVHVAETPLVKLRQAARLIHPDQLGRVFFLSTG